MKRAWAKDDLEQQFVLLSYKIIIGLKEYESTALKVPKMISFNISCKIYKFSVDRGGARPTFNAAGGISFDDEHLEFLFTDAEAACAKLGSVELEKKKRKIGMTDICIKSTTYSDFL